METSCGAAEEAARRHADTLAAQLQKVQGNPICPTALIGVDDENGEHVSIHRLKRQETTPTLGIDLIQATIFTILSIDASIPVPSSQANWRTIESFPQVDPSQREMYLADAEFAAVLGMDKAAFQKLPKSPGGDRGAQQWIHSVFVK